ncbi:MAG: hypothetical protein ACRDUA_03705 [Micromonosporaceae bacterium]
MIAGRSRLTARCVRFASGDDFTPSPDWPPVLEGEVDELRLTYLTHPKVHATEVLTTPATSAVIAVRTS